MVKTDEYYFDLIRRVAPAILYPDFNEAFDSSLYTQKGMRQLKKEIDEWYALPMEERRRIFEKANTPAEQKKHLKRFYIDDYEQFNLMPGEVFKNTSAKPLRIFVQYGKYNEFGKFIIKIDKWINRAVNAIGRKI